MIHKPLAYETVLKPFGTVFCCYIFERGSSGSPMMPKGATPSLGEISRVEIPLMRRICDTGIIDDGAFVWSLIWEVRAKNDTSC